MKEAYFSRLSGNQQLTENAKKRSSQISKERLYIHPERKPFCDDSRESYIAG